MGVTTPTDDGIVVPSGLALSKGDDMADEGPFDYDPILDLHVFETKDGEAPIHTFQKTAFEGVPPLPDLPDDDEIDRRPPLVVSAGMEERREEAELAEAKYLGRRELLCANSPIPVYHVAKAVLCASLTQTSLEDALLKLTASKDTVAVIVCDERLHFTARRIVKALPENLAVAIIIVPKLDSPQPEDWLVVAPTGHAIYNQGL